MISHIRHFASWSTNILLLNWACRFGMDEVLHYILFCITYYLRSDRLPANRDQSPHTPARVVFISGYMITIRGNNSTIIGSVVLYICWLAATLRVRWELALLQHARAPDWQRWELEWEPHFPNIRTRCKLLTRPAVMMIRCFLLFSVPTFITLENTL